MNDITIILIAGLAGVVTTLIARMYFSYRANELVESTLKERNQTLYQRKLDEERALLAHAKEVREMELEALRVEARRRQTEPATRAHMENAAARARGDEIVTLGPWVEKLLEDFGVDPDILWKEEMPPDLAALLPLIRGFVQSGGMARLLQGGEAPPGEGAPPGGESGGLEI